MSIKTLAKSNSVDRSNSDDQAESEAPNFINVMVDIMLSLLAKPSNLLRDVVKVLFSAFCEQLTSEVFKYDILVSNLSDVAKCYVCMQLPCYMCM